MPLKDVYERESKILEKRANLQNDLVFYIALRNNKLAEKQSAYENADIALSNSLGQDISSLEEKIENISVELSELISNPEELSKAWRDYASGYNKRFNNAYEAYKEARKALAKQFYELIEMQREVLELRDYVAKVLPETLANKLTALKTIDSPAIDKTSKYNGYATTADIAYFADCGCISENSIAGATEVILRRRPCTKSFLKLGYQSPDYPHTWNPNPIKENPWNC